MKTPVSSKILPYSALFLVNTIWALSAIVAKNAFTEIQPLMLLFLRFALASIVFAPFVVIKQDRASIRKNDLPRLFFLSFLIAGLGGGGWILGLYFTTATRAAIIAALGPVIASLLEKLLLKKKRKIWAYFGVITAFLGTLLIVVKPLVLVNHVEQNGNTPLLTLVGDLLVLSSAFGSAMYVVLAHRKKDNLHPHQKTVLSFVVGTMIFLPFAIYIHAKVPSWTLTLSWKAWFGILYFGVLCSALAYALWQWAVEKVSAMESAIFTYVEPVIAVIAAVYFLHEIPTITDGIGGLLVIFGILLTILYQDSPKEKPIMEKSIRLSLDKL